MQKGAQTVVCWVHVGDEIRTPTYVGIIVKTHEISIQDLRILTKQAGFNGNYPSFISWLIYVGYQTFGT